MGEPELVSCSSSSLAMNDFSSYLHNFGQIICETVQLYMGLQIALTGANRLPMSSSLQEKVSISFDALLTSGAQKQAQFFCGLRLKPINEGLRVRALKLSFASARLAANLKTSANPTEWGRW